MNKNSESIRKQLSGKLNLQYESTKIPDFDINKIKTRNNQKTNVKQKLSEEAQFTSELKPYDLINVKLQR